jgi:hypothetical protein
MKRKNVVKKCAILCIFSLLFAGTTSVAAQPFEPDIQPTSLNDDVPVWKVGNSWVYTVTDFIVNYNVDGQKVYVVGTIDDLTLRVTDTSDPNYYAVSFTGKVTATYDIVFSLPSITLQLKGTLRPLSTRAKGTILFTKSNLQVHYITADIKTVTAGIIAPLKIPLPLPLKITVDGQPSVDLPLFDFPLSANKYWSMPNLVITMKMNAGGILGLIRIPITLKTSYSWIPFAFHCQSKRDVTVPAGTYSAYKISSILGEFFDYYYAPEVGNLVKIDAKLQNGEVRAELKSVNYP